MSENPLQHQHDAEFERQDLGAKAVLWFLAGLAGFLLAVHFILTGMYGLLDRYSAEHQPPQNPLVVTQPADTRAASPADAKKFPQPRLEAAETTDLRDVRRQEEDILNSYGWVDEKAGVVRLPIDRAMQLIVQQGLPTRPQNPAQPAPLEKKRAGAKAAKPTLAAK